MKVNELEKLSWDVRQNVLDIVMAGNGGHIGGDMSVLNTLLTLYKNHLNITPETVNSPNRDRFVLSKGHCVEAFYAVLAECGFLNLEEIKSQFNKFGSKYIGHPNNKLNGIEMNSGSLGHGLSVCVGMALAAKMNKSDVRVYTIMGDGELAEGSVWEGVMAAGHFGLDNLCAVVDRNNLQISGCTEVIMSHKDLNARFRSFDWNVLEINGDKIGGIDMAFSLAKKCKDKPTVIIAKTTKGYGSKIMENKAEWHHRVPTREEYEQISAEFKARKEACVE